MAAEPQARAMPRSISVVLPAYNEEAIITRTVCDVLDALQRSGVREHEVLVVDDGSSDATAERVQQLQQAHPQVRLRRHGHNRGYGAALRTGFDHAQGEAVLLLDSDGQFDPREMAELLRHWSGDTLVAGYREHRNDSLMRTLNNRAFFAVVRLLFGPSLRDMNCAFKLFPREVGQGLDADGAIISTQLVLRAKRAGYHLVELPVRHLPRTTGKPTGANPRVVLRAFRELWRMRREPRMLQGLTPPER